MRVLDYNLNDQKNGGHVTGLSYSRSLNELISSWSATVAGGSFTAGESISFSGVMTNGIISRAYKDYEGLWHIEGKDSGVKLMRSIPDISEIPTGNAQSVISYLATLCGLELIMTTEGLSGFNVRSCISGSTCAEAILEIAMLSGCIAFIDNAGKLNISAPVKNTPNFEIVIDDSGSDIDLDGYATQTLVNLTRRKWPDTNDDDPGESTETTYSGTTPSTSPYRQTFSGTFSGGSYSITKLMPFDVVEKLEATFTDSNHNITLTVKEEHDYNHRFKTIWRQDQEYVLFAFIETGYTLTKTTQGTYKTSSAESLTFTETTTETMERDMSVFDAVNLPDDWQGELKMVDTETITRSTLRTGGKDVTQNMPDYSPPFDSKITRNFTRERNGRGLFCNETESTYEARQVGTINPVKLNGENIPHFMLDSDLAIQTHSTPEWVLVNHYRTYYERYNRNGECVLSTKSEYNDDGAEWLTAHALSDTGDENINDYQKAYAKFSQNSQGLDISLGSNSISGAWQFIELQGRTKNTRVISSDEGKNIGSISDWYNNGEFILTPVCPFYNDSTSSCNIHNLSYDSSEGCLLKNKGTSGWIYCARALAALDLARQQDIAQVENVIIGSASVKNLTSKTPAAGYQRDLYIDELLSDEQAQFIANTIAQNILNVKGIKGIRKTITIPYSPEIEINGSIVEVSHDWENLQTSVSYLTSGEIPDFMISQSVAGIAAFVSARENSRVNIPKYGTIISCSNGYAQVQIGSNSYSCTTRLKNLTQGDICLVSFAAGNKLRGQVIARL